VSRCAIPIGGFTLWEFSNEFRFQVSGPLSAAVFIDMSDVSPKTVRHSAQPAAPVDRVGARYETPVGPIRLDIGYRVQPAASARVQERGRRGEARSHRGLPPKIFGIPMAIAFGIGEAY